MTNAIGTGQEPALEPASAATKQTEAGVEDARRALDQQALQGREAVQAIKESSASPASPSDTDAQRVDRTA